MKVAICGYPPLAFQAVNQLRNSGIECTHFIGDFVSTHGENGVFPPPPRAGSEFFWI